MPLNYILIILWTIYYFVTQQDVPDSSCILHDPDPESIIFLQSALWWPKRFTYLGQDCEEIPEFTAAGIGCFAKRLSLWALTFWGILWESRGKKWRNKFGERKQLSLPKRDGASSPGFLETPRNRMNFCFYNFIILIFNYFYIYTFYFVIFF